MGSAIIALFACCLCWAAHAEVGESNLDTLPWPEEPHDDVISFVQTMHKIEYHAYKATGVATGEDDGVQAAEAAAGDFLDIFPGTPPGDEDAPEAQLAESLTKSIGNAVADRCCPGDTSLSYFNVSKPGMKEYRVQNPRAFVLVLPGGGFDFLAWRKEGEDIAEWLNSLNVSAFVLKYRVPQRVSHGLDHGVAQIDGQRAMSILRHKAAQYNVGKDFIGVIGFSAGGGLAGMLSGTTQRAYAPIDEIDTEGFNPNFQMMIYSSGLASYVNPLTQHPPIPDTFLASAENDQCVNIWQVKAFHQLVLSKNFSSELHAVSTGHHGYGACTVYNTTDSDEICKWPKWAEQWLESRSLLAAPSL